MQGVSLGDGPIDAAFLALEGIIGQHFELDDFQIQSVTEGQEAVGTALVRLRSNGKLYAGNGVSTDILGANNAGFPCCWFNPKRKPAPEQLRIDYEIQDLRELLDIV